MAAVVQADPAMVADNGKQGQVVLTAEQLEGCGTRRVAYLTRPLDPQEPGNTITFWGCWAVARNQVHVKYFVGNEERYERASFNYEQIQRVAIPKVAPIDDTAADPASPSI